MRSLISKQARRIVALLIIATFFLLGKLPSISVAETQQIASRFAFEEYALPTVREDNQRQVRDVHPELENIQSWISAVGASVAINDMDKDGLANDACYVDTRTDSVIVTPIPDTGARFATFELSTNSLRYDKTMAPMGCLMNDLNEDGRADLLVFYWGRTPVAFLQRADATHLDASSFVAVEVVSGEERWFTDATTLADVNGDGHLDIIVGNYFPDGSAILDPNSTEHQTMQHSMSRALNGGHNRILLWQSATIGDNPTVVYKDASDALPENVATGWTLAIGANDLNGDMLPEIYFSNDFGYDRLLLNLSTPEQLAFKVLEGSDTLNLPSSRVLGRDSFKGMGIDFGDVNHDGFYDLYVSNIAAPYSLYESHFLFLSTGDLESMQLGHAPYVDAGDELGLARSDWSWDARLADFNNDGDVEAMQATGFLKGENNRWADLHETAMGNDEFLAFPRMWHNLKPGDELSGDSHVYFFARNDNSRYVDISQYIGLERNVVSRAIAISDVDGDGDLDFAVANQWETSYFYENVATNNGNFIGLRLMLPVEAQDLSILDGHLPSDIYASPAVGAQVRITLPDGRVLINQVDGGNGHAGQRSSEVHFGIGDISAAIKLPVQIQWRDRNGALHTTNIELNSGWHTILLGANND